MTASTNSSAPAAPPATSSAAPQRKPRFALFVATACGLGYLPLAPGTWGSLGGLFVAMLPMWSIVALGTAMVLGRTVSEWVRGIYYSDGYGDPLLLIQCALAVAVAAIGVWSAGRVAHFWTVKDPQRVVIDEVSGQHLTLLLGCALPLIHQNPDTIWRDTPLGLVSFHSPLGWKYLLLGLILFRVFDIWKPFPARQAESLSGGWGIMADDWVAGIYAALGLWIARAAGL